MKIFSYLKERFKEPSSLAGVAVIAAGVNQVFDINELSSVSEAATSAASSSDWMTAAVTFVMGIAAIFIGERKDKDSK